MYGWIRKKPILFTFKIENFGFSNLIKKVKTAPKLNNKGFFKCWQLI